MPLAGQMRKQRQLGVTYSHLARKCQGHDLKHDWTSSPPPRLFVVVQPYLTHLSAIGLIIIVLETGCPLPYFTSLKTLTPSNDVY